MSNSTEQTLEEEHGPSPSDQHLNDQSDQQSQEWEIMARAWLCSFPEAKAVSMDEVEAWIDSNHDSLPEGIQSMPRSDLCQRLISIQNCMRLPTQGKEANQFDDENPPYRFQRTDQWRPVYSWLESLNQEEVVKSKEISDWLSVNPEVQEQLCSRHSRYHLMHYIKKCHIKILKRKEKKLAECNGSNECSNCQPGSPNTTDQLIKDLDDIDIVLHIGGITYANGYISQWDQFTSQVEPIASAVPYMIGSGNHERDWPNTGSRVLL